MGRINQNTNMSGMQGKGGAARPNPAQQPQQPTAGMGGKGQLSGGQPMQQTSLNNALSGLAGAPTQTYPFPQPTAQQPLQSGMGGKGLGQQQTVNPATVFPAQQPVQGMGGKGLGQQQTDPRMQQALEAMQSQMQGQTMPQPQRTPTPSEMVMLGMGQPQQMAQPVQPVQPGMGGKGVGTRQLDPLLQPYVNAAIGQPVQDLMAQRAAFDAANPQPVNDPNDPYAARFGVPGNYVGTPAPVQVQQPTQSALDAAYSQNLISSAGSGLSPVRQLAPVQPAFTPQPVRAENPRLAQQRQMQQMANRRRFGRR